MNKIRMKGTLTRDAEFKVSATGTAFTRFNIAIKDVKAKRTDYFNIVAFYDLAEEIANLYKKDSVIHFEGKIQNNNYEKDGKKVYSDRIIAESLYDIADVVFEGGKQITNEDDLPF